jgi:FixJ family two-component response regulator
VRRCLVLSLGVVPLSEAVLISVVDDDESFRVAMRDMLESFGCTVTAFASGAEFLGSERLHDSACLITDVYMPGMTGFELHDQIVATGHPIPTIFLTAFPDKKGSDRATKAGAVAYISKPCQRDDLRAHVLSALARGVRRGP